MMEETMNTSVEQEQTSDAFLEGLESGQTSEAADQLPEEAADEPQMEELESTEGETGKEEAEDSPEAPADTRQEAEGAEKEVQEEQKQPDKTAWSVKHMGAERTITAAEVTPELLQKGLDYDRVRGRYNEAKPLMEMFGRLAQKAGMRLPEYVRHIRTEAMRATGMGEAEARRAVDLEDRETAVQLTENYQREKAALITKHDGNILDEMAEFCKTFPEVWAQITRDPNYIPQEVWRNVGKGMSLVGAYSRYAINAAGEQLRAAREGARVNGENHRNALRSTGSMRSAGNDRKSSDPFLEGFGG